MAFFACIAGCIKRWEDMDDESVSDISELSYSTKIESSVHVSTKPAIIGTAAPTDKPTASDQNTTGGKNIAGSSAGNTSDAHAATGGDGGKTENAHSTLSRDSGGVEQQPGDNKQDGSSEIVASSTI